MTHTFRPGLLAGLVLGSLVFMTGCGGSKGVDPKPSTNQDPRIQRIGVNSNTGGNPGPDQSAKPKPSASVN